LGVCVFRVRCPMGRLEIFPASQAMVGATWALVVVL